MTSYDVTAWREPSGDWSAQALGVEGAFTAGRSLAEVERNIRESIAVSLDLPRRAETAMEIRLEVSLPGGAEIDNLVRQARTAREAAKSSATSAMELTAAAAVALRDNGLSMRDIATVLGISFQRAQQLVATRVA